MSRTLFPSLALVLTMLAFPVSPLVGEAPLQSGALAIHGHPQKVSYASPAEWPFVSAQGHWLNPDGTISHTHMECTAPLYAEWPKAMLLTLQCQIQLFHLAGHVYHVWGPMVQPVAWSAAGPIVGDPLGVVVRTFAVTFDQSLGDPTIGPDSCPENGWCGPEVRVRTVFDNGATTDVYLTLPLYAKGDPSVLETPGHIRLASQVIASGGPNSRTVASGHGTSISEFSDSYVPIAPLTSRMTALGHTFSYVLSPDFPGTLFARHIIDPDFHHGNPGTTVFEAPNVLPLENNAVVSEVVFDPVALGTGPHKVALMWDAQTLAGNASFEPNEGVTSLMVVSVNVGDVVTPPPPPGPTPVDCAGSWGVKELTPGEWVRVFRVTTQPANGGASCAVVAAR